MRASEVCNLRLDDLDMKNGSVVVQRLKGSLRTTQALTEHRGEPLLDELRSLREWLRQRPDDGSDFLFNSQKGGRLDRSQFFRLFKAMAGEAGLPAQKQHPHVLKHSLASHLVSANVNLALVKQQLGHKPINSTMLVQWLQRQLQTHVVAQVEVLQVIARNQAICIRTKKQDKHLTTP